MNASDLHAASSSDLVAVEELRSACDQHPESAPVNAGGRIATVKQEIEKHQEQWRPYGLASLLKDFALNLERSGQPELALPWITRSRQFLERQAAMPNAPDVSEQMARVSSSEDRIRAAVAPSGTPTRSGSNTLNGDGRPGRNWRAEGGDDPLAFLDAGTNSHGQSLRELVERLSISDAHPKTGRLLDQAQSFAERVRQLGTGSTDVADPLSERLAADIERLQEFLGVTVFPEDPEQVRSLAAYARSQAMPKNLQPTEIAPRLWWLVAGACNIELVSKRQWSANAPHVTLDAIGYLTALVIQKRYDDDARHFLAASAEVVVREAQSLPPVPFDTSTWCLTAVGLYLLLRGPEAKLPSETKFDSRIHGATNRRDWARALLSASQNAGPESTSTAAIALCQVTGEDINRVEWILDLLFGPASAHPDAADREYWLATCVDFLGRTKRVRVVVNPWRPEKQSTLSSQTARRSDVDVLEVPDRLLQHAVADLLDQSEAVSINGGRFEGRRVPTYLLHNSSGPFGLLKVDTAAKVMREQRNFREAAQRLHSVHRPGESKRGRMTIWVDDQTRLETILTTNVFGPNDQPTTLTEWLDQRPAAQTAVLDDLFLNSLRPWTAFVERDRIDLRMEYPILRPRVPALAGFAPLQKSQTELDRIRRAPLWSATEIGVEASAVQSALDAAAGHDAEPLQLSESAIDPVWLAHELAKGESLDPSHPASELLEALLDFDCLRSRCHGDLHSDNVLCLNPESEMPRLVLIDFESTHVGHVCKDFARLEAALLTQVFTWKDDEAHLVLDWFAATLGGTGEWPTVEPPSAGSSHLQNLVAPFCLRLRELARGCGQTHWPITPHEYSVALLGALLPIARYTTIGDRNQQLALALAAEVAGSLTT